jgi:hypothetical protein
MKKLPKRILHKKDKTENLSQIVNITVGELKNCIYNFRHLHTKSGLVITINAIIMQIAILLMDFSYFNFSSYTTNKTYLELMFPFMGFVSSIVSIVFMAIIVWNIKSAIHTVKIKELYSMDTIDLLKARIEENLDSISETTMKMERLLSFFKRGYIFLLLSVFFLVCTVVAQVVSTVSSKM